MANPPNLESPVNTVAMLHPQPRIFITPPPSQPRVFIYLSPNFESFYTPQLRVMCTPQLRVFRYPNFDLIVLLTQLRVMLYTALT
jgi:hypothetical protein